MITETLKRGYLLASNSHQLERVKYWHKKVSDKVADCHALLYEMEKEDAEFERKLLEIRKQGGRA